MDDITNFKDFICNIKEVMSSFFYPTEEADEKFSDKEHNHPVDNSLNDVSVNPVQNKVIKNALDSKADNVLASSNIDGLMSKSDFGKLQGVDYEANKTIVDNSLSSSSTNPVQNKVIKGALDSKADNTLASGSNNGLMSKSDFTKLGGIQDGANKTIVDSSLSDSSTNPVQNKAIKLELNKKADKNVFATENNDGLMTRDYVNIITTLQQDVNALQSKVNKNDVRILFLRYRNGVYDGATGTQLVVNRGLRDYVYLQVVCDDPNYNVSGRQVRLFINNATYDYRTGNNGVTTSGKLIELPSGTYFISAFLGGNDSKNMVVDHKILIVE